ncbi:MAG: hypothetical protein PSY14_00195 [bacterium]|nr:hypothetical protein [bacterium]
MSISPQTYSDIFNDAVKDSVKRATEVAALYNSGPAEKAAYRAFRAEWDDAVKAHRDAIRAQWQNPDITDLYKKIDRMLDGEKIDADAVKSTLDIMAEKVAAQTTLAAKFDMDRISMQQTMNGIKMAEKGMRGFPEADKILSLQTHDKLLDRSTLGQLETTVVEHRDIYLDIAQKAMEKAISPQQGQKTKTELAQYLDGRPATGKPITAPATARFRKGK